MLGIKILRYRSQGIIRLSQEIYIDKVLYRFNMKDNKLGDTPIAKGDKFSFKQCPNLNNKMMQEMCEDFKIQHHNSTPYRPKMNGAVEAGS